MKWSKRNWKLLARGR